MENDIKNIEKLIANVDLLNQHQQEVKKLKGEHFNIFSVLQMEYQENSTHSAFLGELLKPEGSHLLKDLFLGHFVKVIGYVGKLNIKSTNVELEKHIGAVNLRQKTGGRIDIYLSDSHGNSISIENKVYTDDQESQIERYANHNIGKNKVYYLTLFGDNPSKKSIGDLKEGVNYFNISYHHTIIKWLTLCMKEAAEQPMLRESIRQYILLIKKLTNQLTDNAMENQVIESIKRNYSAAKIIADNIDKAELDITNIFLSEIKEKLEGELGEECIVKISEDLTQSWTGLIVTFSDWNGIQIKLEGQSKIPWHDSIFGIRANRDKWNREDIVEALSKIDELKSGIKNNQYWPYYQYILRFSQTIEREKLFNANQRKILVDNASEKLIELVKLCRIPFTKIRRIEEK